MALDDIGTTEAQARRVRAVAETDNGERVYFVDVYTEAVHYVYEVRARDGRIMRKTIEYTVAG